MRTPNIIKDTIKDAVDAEHLVASLGIVPKLNNARELRAPCPVHGGDNKTAFRLKKDTKTWVCFTKSCHLTHGNDSIGLVEGVLKVGFEEALRYLSDLTGIPLDDKDTLANTAIIRKDLDMKKAAAKRKIIYMPPSDVTEHNLKQYMELRTDYFEREENGNFPTETLEKFEIGGNYYDRFDIQREIIPIRDEAGKLVAFSGRAVDNSIEPKYLLTNGFNKDNVLYNLFRARKNINMKNDHTLLVVEGFKAVWFLHQLGYDNVVACMGNYITPGQNFLICKYALNLVLVLDGGEAGQRGVELAMKDLAGRININPIYLPDDGKSPDDYPPDVVIDWLKNIPN